MLHTVDLVRLPDRRRKTTNTSTMAAAGNGPLAPHMLSKIPLRCVGLIGDDAPSKRIWFLLAMNRSKAHKMLRWCSDDMNLALPLECFGDLCRLVAGKMHIRLIGHHTRLIRRDVLEFMTTYAALGGHFRRRRPWWCRCCWSLAVGRRCLHGHKSYIRLGIVWNKFIPV